MVPFMLHNSCNLFFEIIKPLVIHLFTTLPFTYVTFRGNADQDGRILSALVVIRLQGTEVNLL